MEEVILMLDASILASCMGKRLCLGLQNEVYVIIRHQGHH